MIARGDGAGAAPAVGCALELEGIAHRFGGRWVLRGCTLRVEPGESVALLGGNGAGKTTLLRIAATLLAPSRGTARVLGMAVGRDSAAVRRRIGMMGFMPGLYEDLSAEENLQFACKMRGERPDPARIAALLDEVGLAAHAQLRVRGFSSGMRRRVALARVLLSPPDLLLLDEPYAALDDEGADRINDVIRSVVARGGAVISATHDLPRALPVVDRVVRLDAGLLREVPVPADEPGLYAAAAQPAGFNGGERWRA